LVRRMSPSQSSFERAIHASSTPNWIPSMRTSLSDKTRERFMILSWDSILFAAEIKKTRLMALKKNWMIKAWSYQTEVDEGCLKTFRPPIIHQTDLKGLHNDFHRKIKKGYSQKHFKKILPKLRGYNNYSHQIAFEMEETQLKSFVYKSKPWGVC
jgi:hypothetical protein